MLEGGFIHSGSLARTPRKLWRMQDGHARTLGLSMKRKSWRDWS